ncbi:MAG: tetratricopeptide repeat protein [Chloroflexota bacterium]
MSRVRAALCLVSLMFLLSCAGLGVRNEAEEEFTKGLSLFDKGRYAEAVAHFERATDLEPNYGVAYLYAGRCYVTLRKWESALPALRTAFRLAPEETKRAVLDILTDALYSASLAEFHKGNLKSSGKYLDEAVKLDPSRSNYPSLFRDSTER